MGTNYYLRTDDKEEVDQHIGKNSRGWVFGFNGQVHKTYDDWVKALLAMTPNQIIVDEYGNVHSTEDFIETVQDTLKPWGRSRKQPASIRESEQRGKQPKRNWQDRGFSFSNYEFC